MNIKCVVYPAELSSISEPQSQEIGECHVIRRILKLQSCEKGRLGVPRRFNEEV